MPSCFDAALPGGDYCRPHQREHTQRERWQALQRFNQRKWYNRRCGKCWCGAGPIEGRRVCFAHHATEIESRERRRRAIKTLPAELRRYVSPGRRGYLGAMDMRRWEIERARRQSDARLPVMPRLANDRLRAFVRFYVEQGQRNGERAAIRAGYGVASAAKGGRAAAVKASMLRKRPNIQAAIREVAREQAKQRRRDQERQAAAVAEREQRATVRALGYESVAELIAVTESMMVDDAKMAGPQSLAARELRRRRGQTVLRLPGRCRCGKRAGRGLKSCAGCRRERRHYRRRYRGRRRKQARRDTQAAWVRAFSLKAVA